MVGMPMRGTPKHASQHETGGVDEIGVDGLSGLLADGQTPLGHHTTHESGGADEIKDIELKIALVYNDTGSGILVVGRVGENVSAGDILYMKADGHYWKADADSVDTMPAKVMAMAAISASALGKLLHMGYFRHDDWDWTRGDGEANLLFASVTPGAMSQTQPAGSGDQVQVVGYVVTADIVFFNPCYELVEIS